MKRFYKVVEMFRDCFNPNFDSVTSGSIFQILLVVSLFTFTLLPFSCGRNPKLSHYKYHMKHVGFAQTLIVPQIVHILFMYYVSCIIEMLNIVLNVFTVSINTGSIIRCKTFFGQ